MQLQAASFLAVCALTSGAAAQGFVSPAHFTATGGNTALLAGLGESSTPTRYLQVHDDLVGAPRVIQGLAPRREKATSTLPVAAYSVVADLWLSSATTSSAAPDANFDANHGADKKRVATFQLFHFPTAAPTGVVMPFSFQMPFAQPFSYPRSAPLAWEVQVSTRTNNGTVLFDACSGTGTNPQAESAVVGIGCKTTGATMPMALSGTSQGKWTSSSLSLSLQGINLPKNALVALTFGASNTLYGNVPLPAAIPGTTGFPSGTCTVSCDWLVQVPVLTTASGTLSQVVGGTVHPGQHGASVFSQIVALDAAANATGVVTSNLLEQQVVAPFGAVPVGRVTPSGATAQSGAIVAFF